MNKLLKMIAAASFLKVASLGNPRFRVVHTVPANVRLVGGGRHTARVGTLAEALSKATVKELRTMATAMKIKGRSKARRKADLVALIARAKGGGR